MEHRHRCVYCHASWFCYDDCPRAGLSACEGCREKLARSPEIPRRVIAIEDTRVLDRLAEREAERVREMIRRRHAP